MLSFNSLLRDQHPAQTDTYPHTCLGLSILSCEIRSSPLWKESWLLGSPFNSLLRDQCFQAVPRGRGAAEKLSILSCEISICQLTFSKAVGCNFQFSLARSGIQTAGVYAYVSVAFNSLLRDQAALRAIDFQEIEVSFQFSLARSEVDGSYWV